MASLPNNRRPRIHICGAPRSGTTILQALMISSFDVDPGPVGEVRLWQPVARVEGRPVLCTKNPKDEALGRLVLPFDNRLFLLAIVRDPRDVVLSRHFSDPTRYFMNFRVWKESALAIKGIANHPRFCLVRYEDLVQNPDEVQTRIAEWLPFLEATASFSDYRPQREQPKVDTRALNQDRPISGDRVGGWRQALGRVKGEIETHGPITEDLIHFGYEKNADWEQVLINIEPEFAPTQSLQKVSPRKKVSIELKKIAHAAAYLRNRYLSA